MRVSYPPLRLQWMVQTFHLLLILISFAILHAQQNPQPHFRNYSTEQGLPSSEVHCVFQDSRGYMWFGTDNGVAKFDGYEFHSYGTRDGLNSNVIFDIYEDSQKRIWIGTMTGETYIFQGDTITPYVYNNRVTKSNRHFGHANFVYAKNDGTTFFNLMFAGILQIDKNGNDSLYSTLNSLAYFILEVEKSPKLLYTSIRRSYEKGLSYSTNHTIELLSGTTRHQFELPYLSNECHVRFNASKLASGEIIVTACQQLFCFRNNKLLWAIPYTFEASRIIIDENQTIWVCGINGGGIRRYTTLEGVRNGIYDHYLKGLSISNVCKDNKGGLWITSLEQGIFFCNDQQSLIFDSKFGLSEDQVTSVTFKSGDELFVGCENGEIFQIDVEKDQIINSFTNPYGYHNFDLLFQEDKSILWSNGSYWQNGNWHHVKIKNPNKESADEFISTKVQKLHINAQEYLVGCNYAGFLMIDLENDSVRYSTFFNNFRERTFAVHTDRNQTLWVGNLRGLFAFRDSVLVSPDVDHPAFQIRVEDIDEMPDGSLVFGTKGLGVVRWKGQDIVQVTTDEGLTADMIEDIHVDESGTLWVGTLNGLNKVTFGKYGQVDVRSYTVSNGLPSNEMYQIKSFDGQLWLCTAKGLIKFHEPAIDTLASAPVLQSLQVNDSAVSWETTSTFSHDQNNLAFRFLTINYQQNGQIPYRYRLGETEAWLHTQNRSVQYPKLSPGDYSFEVQAQNQDGYWSVSTVYAFAIRPPWWNTAWAQAGFLGLLLGGLILYQRQHTQKIKKEAAIQQQISSLERAALQAQMNPHFIFNCLNSIQHFILQNDQKQAVEFLSRFAQLVRHNLNASVKGRVSLEEELGLLDNYLAVEQERFDHRFTYAIEVDEALNQQAIHLPPLLIQPYVENAIAHGLSPQKEQGEVRVHFRKEEGLMVVRVRDNGVGIQPRENRPTNTRHESVGMTLTQKRLELLRGTGDEAVKITDLQEEGKTKGTEVEIRIVLSPKP